MKQLAKSIEQDRRDIDRLEEECRLLRERSLKVAASWHLDVKRRIVWPIQRLVKKRKFLKSLVSD